MCLEGRSGEYRHIIPKGKEAEGTRASEPVSFKMLSGKSCECQWKFDFYFHPHAGRVIVYRGDSNVLAPSLPSPSYYCKIQEGEAQSASFSGLCGPWLRITVRPFINI